MSKKKKIILTVVAVFLVLIITVVTVGAIKVKQYLGYINYDTQEEPTIIDIPIEKVEEEPTVTLPDTKEEVVEKQEDAINSFYTTDESLYYNDPNVTNILLIGSDTRSTTSFSGNSDAMIIVSINKKNKRILLTSIMRDVYVKYPTQLTMGGKKVSYGKLNAAYLAGGGKFLIKTIESNFRINIDKYVAVNFVGFVDGIDILGGVDITLKEGEAHYINGYATEICKIMGKDINENRIEDDYVGTIKLNGVQALSYSRIRYIGDDFERTERQRKVLTSLFNKAKTSDISTIDQVLTKVLPMVLTDMTSGEILGYASNAVTYLGYDMKTLRLPVYGTYESLIIDRQSHIGIKFEENYNKYIEALTK